MSSTTCSPPPIEVQDSRTYTTTGSIPPISTPEAQSLNANTNPRVSSSPSSGTYDDEATTIFQQDYVIRLIARNPTTGISHDAAHPTGSGQLLGACRDLTRANLLAEYFCLAASNGFENSQPPPFAALGNESLDGLRYRIGVEREDLDVSCKWSEKVHVEDREGLRHVQIDYGDGKGVAWECVVEGLAVI